MNTKYQKTILLARCVRYSVFVLLVCDAAGMAIVTFAGHGTHALTGHLQVSVPEVQILMGHPRLSVANDLIVGALFFGALIEMARLAYCYEKCQFFSKSAVGLLRRFALLVLLGSLSNTIFPALVLSIVNLLDGSVRGNFVLGVDIHSADIEMVITSTFLFAISWILVEARQIHDENKLFI